MARPSTVPTWATDPGAEVEAPLAGKQASGYATNDVLGAGILNWLFNKGGALLQWLHDHAAATDEDNAFSVAQTFNAGINSPSAPISSPQVCKARGRAYLNFGVGSLVASTGYNVTSVAVSGDSLVVTFTSALANTNYQVIATVADADANNPRLQTAQPHVATRTVNAFSMEMYDKDGVSATLAGRSAYVDFVVF